MAVKVSVSPLGAAVGAFLGAVARPLVVYAYLQGQPGVGEGMNSILSISAMIGLCVGGLGGLIGKPLISAVVGGALGVAAYYLTFIPLAFCLCLTGLEQGTWGGDPPEWWAVMLTGALPAAVGAGTELIVNRRRAATPSTDVPSAEPPPPPGNEGQGPWIS